MVSDIHAMNIGGFPEEVVATKEYIFELKMFSATAFV